MSKFEYKYTVKDVAKMFGVTAERVRIWCREEKIRFLKLPGQKGGYRFSQDLIKDFIARQNSEPAGRGLVGLKKIVSIKR